MAEAANPPQATPAQNNPPDAVQENRTEEVAQKKNEPVSNGTHASPSKSPTKLPTPKKVGTPSPLKSPSKPATKTPETPSTADKKKVPMNKVQVGAAPSPNLKVVKSKIGSLENTSYKPGGGNVKIENRKLDFSKTQPKIAAKNETYSPGGGDKKIQQVKLQWNAKPKVGSLENAAHKPGGGDKKIETVKLDFKEKAKPKVGSKDNLKHIPGGGTVKIEDQKLDIKAQSKIGSLDNLKHKPGGGDKKIFDDKEYLKQMTGYGPESQSSASQENIYKHGRNKSSDRKSLPDMQKSQEELNDYRQTEEKPTDQNFNQLAEKDSTEEIETTKNPLSVERVKNCNEQGNTISNSNDVKDASLSSLIIRSSDENNLNEMSDSQSKPSGISEIKTHLESNDRALHSDNKISLKSEGGLNSHDSPPHM